MKDSSSAANRIAIAIGVAFFFLYALTAAPSIVALYDDTLEFQFIGPTFGIAHPTGYPLYTVLGGLWSRLLFPVGNWAWRMNLFSALAAAVTVALVFALTREIAKAIVSNQAAYPSSPENGVLDSQLERRNSRFTFANQRTRQLTPGIVAALAFGLGPIWWSQATIAEVYALHNLLVVLALWQSVQLATTDDPSPQNVRRVTLLALTVGLGLTHHRTIVLLIPGMVLLLAGQGWIWRPSRYWLRWGIALFAPLLLYLYLPLRASMGVRDLNGSYVNSWDGFWHHVLALGYTGFFTENALTRILSAGEWVQLWWQQFGLTALALGLIGIGWSGWSGRRRQLWAGLLIVLLTNVGFALAYRVGDPELFMLPAWLSFAPWIGVAVAWLHQWGREQMHVVRAGQAFILFMIVIGIDGRGAPVNRSQDWAIHDYAVAMAKVDFPQDSRVIGLEGQISALRYMQAAEGLGINAQGIVANDPIQRVQAIEEAMQRGYALYLTQEVDGIADDYSFSGEGVLVRVWPRGKVNIKQADYPLNTKMADDQLTLNGYDLTWLEEAGGAALRIALYWEPQTSLKANYKVSLRLFDETGTPLHNSDGEALIVDRFPLRQVAPTSTWQPSEIIRDVYDLALTPNKRADAQSLEIILYDATTIIEAGRIQIPLAP